jgi:hypothetical protein
MDAWRRAIGLPKPPKKEIPFLRLLQLILLLLWFAGIFPGTREYLGNPGPAIHFLFVLVVLLWIIRVTVKIPATGR